MVILSIEYQVADFGEWKAVFDKDPMGRKSHGVVRHWIYQDSDDPHHLMVSLEFPSAEAAKAFRAALQPVWTMSGAGQAWVLREAEARTY
jgi:hypothetical protein